jgi:hypothetical protein
MISSASDRIDDELWNTQPRSVIPQEGSENTAGIDHDAIVGPLPASTPTIFSSQNTSMDELTSRGIETRTGVPKDNLSSFGIKELIDNAVDHHEIHHHNLNINNSDSKPRLRIQVIKEPSLTRILIRNSDPYHHEHEIFTKQKIDHVFDLDRIYSSKRYQFRISRGALGDALKEVLRIPYILATEGHQYTDKITYWKEPLIIRTTQRTFNVTLHVDRIEQSRRSYVEEYQVQNKCNNSANFTEVEFRIPASSLDLAELKTFLKDYITATPHIDFTFIDENNKVSRFEQVQPIRRDWTNMCSIYYYTYHEFSEFVHGLEDDSMIVHRVLRSVFREGSNMKKTELTSISVGQLKRSPELILQVFELLRDIKLNHLGPISDSSDLSLPFNSNKKIRTAALRKRFEQRGLEISDLKYKSKFGYYKDEKTGVEFPFFYEIAVVSTTNLANNLYYIESLNSSVMPGKYSFMQGHERTFRWETRSEKYSYLSGSIFRIFEHYGYSYDSKKCKKPHTIIFVNLISPKINYKSYGKSNIDLKPFASVIAETTVKACSGGGGGHNNKYDDQGNKVSATSIFTEYLIKRYKEVLLNPDLKKIDRWNTSTPVYRIRPILQGHGINRTRLYLQGLVKGICDRIPELKLVNGQFTKTGKIGVEREALGIFEATRAHIYFRGKTYDVSFDALENIKKIATFILIIEKAGIVELLAPFADQYGFALCDTGGFLTDNAKKFSKLASKEGARVAILTDGDMTGWAIAGEVRDIPRIGIALESLEKLGIPIEEVAEDLVKDSPHKSLAKKLYYQRLIPEQDWEFLNRDEHGRRVEIDNVIGYVGTQRFWNDFVLPSIAKKFTSADYNLSFNRIEYVILPELKVLNELTQKKGSSAAIETVQNVESEYSNYDISSQGFISDIETEEQKIEKRVMEKELEDKNIQWLSQKLESLNKDFSKRTGIMLPLENMEEKAKANVENTDNLDEDMGYEDMGYDDDINDVNS